MQRISLGALIIALALLVDDAMTTTDAMLTRLAQGDDKVEAATFAFRTYAFAMLAGTLVTIAGFVPVGFAASSAGEYTFSLFAVVAIALIVSWFVAVHVCAAARRRHPDAAQGSASGRARAGCSGLYRSFLTAAMRAKWLTIALTIALFVAVVPRAAADPAAVLSRRRTGPNCWSISACRRMPRSMPAKTRRAALRRGRSRATRMSRAGAPMSAAARSASTCRSNVQLPNDFFAQAVIVAKDVRGARAAAEPSWRRSSPTNFRAWSAASIRSSSARRSAGRCNIASAVPTSRRSARSRFKLAAGRRDQSAGREGQLRLDRAGAAGAHPRSIRTRRACWV